MKEAKKLFQTGLKKLVEKTLETEANNTSCVLIYQPKAPKNLDRYKKAEK